MKRYPSLFWTGLLVTGVLVGCGTKSPLKPADPVDPFVERKLDPEVAASARSLVESNNRFALDLYAHLRTDAGNLFLSPYSVSTAFGMACAGATGQTRDEMATVFHFTLPDDELHRTFGALQRSIDRGGHLGGYELRTANRAWGQEGFPFLGSYLEVTREHYGAELQVTDFITAPEAARQSVNRWVEERTNDKIPELFPAGSISSATRLVLANAIYFKGFWAKPFDKEKTIDAPFYLSAGESVPVSTMIMNDKFRIAQMDELQVLELRYKGADLSMLLLLPGRIDGLADLEASLTLERLTGWIDRLAEDEVLVRLPRYTFSSKFKLPDVLAAMGMPSAFGEGADFSGIDGRRDLFIGHAFHQAFVEVNEEGTEAAAATGIGFDRTSVPPSFVANHPFLFLIYDHVTGSILFLGRVADPRG